MPDSSCRHGGKGEERKEGSVFPPRERGDYLRPSIGMWGSREDGVGGVWGVGGGGGLVGGVLCCVVDGWWAAICWGGGSLRTRGAGGGGLG